jgi:hypothetical protein
MGESGDSLIKVALLQIGVIYGVTCFLSMKLFRGVSAVSAVLIFNFTKSGQVTISIYTGRKQSYIGANSTGY